VQQNAHMHGTFVALGNNGVLLRGAPGAGKSDLALRFLYTPHTHLNGIPVLIADDQVILARTKEGVIGSCPEPLKGKIEVRGLGLLRAPLVRSQARLTLIIELAEREDVPRLPGELAVEDVLDCTIPVLPLYPFESSAPIKLALAIKEFGTARSDEL
jgi:HPr kinase/phosphorylase